MSVNKATIYKERIKTVLLVVLFITAVLLSYLYWRDSSFLEIKESMDNRLSLTSLASASIPEPSEFICPDSVDVNFGDGTYTSFHENVREVWDLLLPFYIDFTKAKGLTVEVLSEQQWDNIMGFQSAQCSFCYPLPDAWLRSRGAKNYGESDYFAYLTVLAFSNAFDDSFFIRSSDGSCFRIRASEYDSSAILSAIEDLRAKSRDQYYPMNQFLGTDNTTITPFATDIDLPSLQFDPSVPDQNSSFKTDLARNFFGQSLDFIRTVTDNNGTTIFMYNYGETSLTVYPNGFFEYQDSPVAADKTVGFTEAFRTATAFIAEHGTWSAHDGKTIHFLLEDLDRETYDRSSVYTFRFRSHYNGRKIYGSDNVLTIVVTGGQVTYYSRNLMIPGEEDFSVTPNTGTANYPFVDVVSGGYESIARELQRLELMDPPSDPDALFDAVLEQIEGINTGYYEITENHRKVCRPAWILTFPGNARIFYDLYTGEYLGTIA
ncbi:MAG: hypothetical protein IJG57_00280 [Firmicutes bacterium]|nr:hypothetical protein [Bacillota bacterium]